MTDETNNNNNNEENVDEPRSLLVGETKEGKEFLQSKLFSHVYDSSAIIISIADVTTDIIVLLSYYTKDRLEFFYISLAILLTSQLAYLFLFWYIFDLDSLYLNTGKVWYWFDKKDWSKYKITKKSCCWYCGIVVWKLFCIILALVGFGICLLLGHLVSFVIYFCADDNSYGAIILKEYFGIKKLNPMYSGYGDPSPKEQFLKEKINKHGGFMIEAFVEGNYHYKFLLCLFTFVF